MEEGRQIAVVRQRVDPGRIAVMMRFLLELLGAESLTPLQLGAGEPRDHFEHDALERVIPSAVTSRGEKQLFFLLRDIPPPPLGKK